MPSSRDRHDKVPIKDYVDAVNAEHRRTDNMRAIAIVGTFGALTYGILKAVSVYASTNAHNFSLHNDLIRSTERQLATQAAQFATKADVAPIKEFVDGERSATSTRSKFWAAIVIAVGLALSVGFGGASLWQAADRASTEAQATESQSDTPRVVIPLPPAEPISD